MIINYYLTIFNFQCAYNCCYTLTTGSVPGFVFGSESGFFFLLYPVLLIFGSVSDLLLYLDLSPVLTWTDI